VGRYSEDLTLAEVLADPEFAEVIARLGPQFDLDHPFLKIIQKKKIADLRKLIPNQEMKEQLAQVEAELRTL
jgi:hypothetical protein